MMPSALTPKGKDEEPVTREDIGLPLFGSNHNMAEFWVVKFIVTGYPPFSR